MAKSQSQTQFPYYIRRSVYLIDQYFIPIKPGKLFRKLRAIKTKAKYLSENDLKPFLINPDFKETREKYWLDVFFNNMLSKYTIGRICEALQNLNRYADLGYPKNFKLLEGYADYLNVCLDGYELLL